MAATAVLVLAPLIYLIIASNTGDLLWASPVFNYQPQLIMIHCFGEKVYLDMSATDFEALTRQVNRSLTGRKRWDTLTLSNETYQDYQSSSKVMVVELSYSEPIRVHSRYKFYSNVDRIIIPLVGRHAQMNVAFGRRFNLSAPGSFHVDSMAPVEDFLAESGLCIKPES